MGEKLVNIIIGIFLLLLVVTVAVTLYLVFAPGTDCTNAAEWKVVRRTLLEMERGSREKITIPFNNGNCPLVAFSPAQIRTVAPGSPKIISDNPVICMCEIDQGKCRPYKECYTLTKFEKATLPPET